ncbi:DHA1 family L-arabinose/isopropyl-beta-D-thiogalactopyranoside export protein-like MFS transporter/DHA1 family inner membrane transport protein [Kribbella pratensis]|uniref:DHA1 family L-arabinose/isopropyl-beta-D-thiogalactopyranoside export protein-like MFS transporter/DHA1 family inner membrane transport protein n=1 Tax=Kribbella pratensis TaxID=2512112 RepID=A0ABY2FIR3_9ACTN|nr:MFS transporter [Kribbella pratensis]TDW93001.1 DHA1 family L-arabinose/isopropyl-beta-D-thiogalactopyranoside export protein-like MFS transporter/DHA1 family inner membrane transport protein [Kribbella pratensis]
MPLSSRRAIAALVFLGVSTFSFVTVEVLPIGLLTVIADDLERSRSQVGLLVTGYAAVVVLASIPLARLTHHLPRRVVLTGTLGVLTAATALSAAAPSYETLFAARLLIALSQALFWSIAPPIATSLFPPEFRGRVVARLAIGTALAPILGIPVGTWLGEQAGWRVPFVVMTVLGAAASVGIAVLLPRTEVQDSPSRRGSSPDLRRYVVLLVASAVGVTGFLTFNTYITPFLLDISGVSSEVLGPMLLASGAGGLAGTVIVGRVLDRYPWGATVLPLGLITIGLLGLYALGQVQVVTVALIAVIGLAFSGLAVAVQSRTLQIAPGSTDIASAGTSSAFNVGIAAGAFVGGALIDTTTVRAVALVGGLLAAAATLVMLSEPLLVRQRRTVPECRDDHAVCEEPV